MSTGSPPRVNSGAAADGGPVPAQAPPRRTGWSRQAGAAYATGRVETTRYMRDRVAFFTVLFMPALLATLIGLTIGASSSVLPIAVVDVDATTQSQDLEQALSDSPALDVETAEDIDDVKREVRTGTLSAGVEIPAGFADTPSGQTAQIFVYVDPTSTDAGPVASAINAVLARISQQEIAAEVTITVLGEAGVPPEQLVAVPDVAEQVAGELPPVEVDVQTVGVLRPDEENAFAFTIPSQMTLFIFLNGLFTGAVLVDSRRLGVSRRMMSAPVGFSTQLTGLGGARVALGILQAAIMFGVGLLLFRVDFGDPVAVITIAVLWSFVGAAAGMLLGSLVKTDAQNTAIATPVGIVFAMLGGCMWPLSVVSPFMRAIGHLTPHAWAMDAWNTVVNDGGGISDIMVEMGVLVAFTVVLGVLATLVLRRRLVA